MEQGTLVTLGQVIRYLREKADLTQASLANKIHVSPKSIGQWEANATIPTDHHLEKLMHVLNSVDPRDMERFIQVLPASSRLAGAYTLLHQRLMPKEPLCSWNDAIDIASFVGREEETQTVRHWISRDRCRIVSVFGRGGMGKTSLAVKVAHECLSDFDAVIFRSVQNGHTVRDILLDCLHLFSQGSTVPEASEACVPFLLRLFQERRCLVLLDNMESLLREDGTFTSGFVAYQRLLTTVATVPHQSCLLITSREMIEHLRPLTGGMQGPVRSLELTGLSPVACQHMLEEKGLFGTEVEWETLVRHHSGNALTLKIIGEEIAQLFDGDIARFLSFPSFDPYVPSIRTLLEDQMKRLSQVEMTLLFWLALAREPIALEQLATTCMESVSFPELLQATSALRRRSLIEQRTSASFSIQPLIQEYFIDLFLKHIGEEILEENEHTLSFLRQFPLLYGNEYVRKMQIMFHLKPLLDQIRVACQKRRMTIDQCLRACLERLRQFPPELQGYGPGNILNMFFHIHGQLADLDASRLLVRNGFFHEEEIHNVDFSGSTFVDCVWKTSESGIRCMVVSPTGVMAVGHLNGSIDIRQQHDLLQYINNAHVNFVWCLVFLSDTILVSGGFDGLIKLWDSRSGQCLRILQGHEKWVRSLCILRDEGREWILSAGDDGTLRLWEPETGQHQVIRQCDAGLWSLAIDSNDAFFACGDTQGKITVWGTQTRVPLSSWQAHTGAVACLAFCPQTTLLASSGVDGTVKIWEKETGTCLGALHHEERVMSLAWCPFRPTWLVSASHDMTVRVWDTRTMHCVQVIDVQKIVWHVGFEWDTRFVLGTHDGSVQAWDFHSGVDLFTCAVSITGFSRIISALACHPDGTFLGSGGDNGDIVLWTLPDVTRTCVWKAHTARVNTLCFSHDQLISGGDDGTVRVWKTASGECEHVLDLKNTIIWVVRLNKEGTVLAVGGSNGIIYLYDMKTMHALMQFDHGQWIWGLAFHPDGTLLASVSSQGTIHVWSLVLASRIKTFQTADGTLVDLAFTPDGRLISSSSGITQWNLETETDEHSPSQHAQALWLGAHGLNEEATAVAMLEQQRIHIHSVTDQTRDRWIGPHAEKIWSVALNHHRFLACGDSAGGIRVWDLSRERDEPVVRYHDRPYQGMCLSGVKNMSDATRRVLADLGGIVEK